jgi:hypothetical protein
MDKGRQVVPEFVGKWGPLPLCGPRLSEEEKERGRAVQELLRLTLDIRYHLFSEVVCGATPSRRAVLIVLELNFIGRLNLLSLAVVIPPFCNS